MQGVPCVGPCAMDQRAQWRHHAGRHSDMVRRGRFHQCALEIRCTPYRSCWHSLPGLLRGHRETAALKTPACLPALCRWYLNMLCLEAHRHFTAILLRVQDFAKLRDHKYLLPTTWRQVPDKVLQLNALAMLCACMHAGMCHRQRRASPCSGLPKHSACAWSPCLSLSGQAYLWHSWPVCCC